ncbi:MAG: ABC transporter permease [Bacilli bacterium]|jgi:ABC-2 type transport system permease protein|nr:ABC transporter permease [Bacilli bacterium]
MSLYKIYLKLIKKNFFAIFIYFFVSIGISVAIFQATSNQNQSFDLNATKNTKIGLIVKSTNTKDDGLVSYLNDIFTVVNAKENTIKDDLFYNVYDYVLIIDNNKYDSYQAPNTINAYLIQSYVNNYLNTFHSYEEAKLGLSQEQIKTKTIANLKNNITIDNVSQVKQNQAQYYYNMFTYGMLASIIVAIGTIMINLNKRNIFIRTSISSMSLRKRNIILFSCHLIFAILIYAIAMLISVQLFRDMAFTSQFYLYALNSLVFTLTIVGFGFMLSQLFAKNETLSGLVNTLSLGLSFLSGAFIPQAYLNNNLLNIMHFSFTTWFIENNEKIKNLANFNLSSISIGLIAQLISLIIFVIIGLLLSKRKANNAIY